MPDDGAAWLPGPLEDTDRYGAEPSKPGLKRRFVNATWTGGDQGDDLPGAGTGGNPNASMSADTEKRRNPHGRRNYNAQKYHQWETEKGNPLMGPRRAGPTAPPAGPFIKPE